MEYGPGGTWKKHLKFIRYEGSSSCSPLWNTRKVDELNAVIKKHNAILVEDAAESMGATYMSTDWVHLESIIRFPLMETRLLIVLVDAS